MKERKISRFKVSVVTEPDPSKLVISEPKVESRNDSNASINENDSQKQAAIAAVINETFDSLKTTLVGSLPAGAGRFP